MLRYKNSLLERILLEKGRSDIRYARLALMVAGIDVQAELKSKELPAPGNLIHRQPKPIQRTAIHRQQQLQRSNSASTCLIPPLRMPAPMIPNHSPRSQPTPTSQTSSPTSAQSPGFAIQGGIHSPHTSFHAQHQRQRLSFPSKLRIPPPDSHPSSAAATPSTIGGTSHDGGRSGMERTSGHWPSPYQTHIEHLGKLTPILSLHFHRAMFVLD